MGRAGGSGPAARRPWTAIAFAAVGGMALLLVLVVVLVPWSGTTSPAPQQPIFDDEGNLAMPMPSVSSDVELTANDDGSTHVELSVDYVVTHPSSPGGDVVQLAPTAVGDDGSDLPQAQLDSLARRPGLGQPRPDLGIVTVRVSPVMGPGGPIRLSPMFEQTLVDTGLDQPTTTSQYTVRLDPATTAFLREQGLGSGDPAEEAAARRFIDIDIQQMRDFKVVDGRWDWQQGRAHTAADEPVRAADLTDDSTITVNNSTDLGVASVATSPDGGPDQLVSTVVGGEATNLALAGSAVECIEQGNGSNPQGFSTLNGWDIVDGLAPGVIPPGASVTQQVNADESLGTGGLEVAQQTSAAAVQVLAASTSKDTGGLKDAATATYLLALGIEELSTVATVALGVPIEAILGLVQGIDEVLTDSCASFANMFNLTAAEPGGAQASYTWGDQTDGLLDVYDSASYGGFDVTNNVQLVPSNGIFSLLASDDDSVGEPYSFHPYLEQVAEYACGTGDDGCGDDPGPANNVIDVRWTYTNPCPEDDPSDCTPTPDELASLPEVDVPGTSLCGPSNELCPTLAAPNAGASEVIGYDPTTLDDAWPYQVIGEHQMSSPVAGLAALDETSTYVAESSGTVWHYTPESAAVPVLTVSESITAMTGFQGRLVYADTNGGLWSYDPGDGSVEWFGEVAASGITQMTEVGGLLYLASDDALSAMGQDWSIDTVSTDAWSVDGATVTSMTADEDDLFVGFTGGAIEACELTDCAGTWRAVHDGAFDSDANALTTVGDTLYVGLQDGAVAQIDPSTDAVQMMSGSGSEGLAIGAMGTVDGNVYLGGCIGLQSPVSGDLLGVVVLDGLTGDGEGTFSPEAPYPSTCQNPSASTSTYRGYDAADAHLLVTPATEDHPPLVFSAFTIDSGTFLYALESTAPFTDALCLSSDGACPSPPPPPPPPPSVPAPPGSVEGLGPPQVVSTCQLPGTPYLAATDDAPVTTSLGQSVTQGFELSAPAGSGCETTFAWDLNHAGSLPYQLWQANLYPTQTTSVTLYEALREPLPFSAAGSMVNGADDEVTTATLETSGAQLSAALEGADVLVLSIIGTGGGDTTSLVVTDDVLTAVGQNVPPPTPLFGAPEPERCDVPHAELASQAAAIYPLDGGSTTVVDVSGNGHDAIATDPAAFDVTPGPIVPCPDVGAMRFDGTTSKVTATPTIDPELAGDELTVMAWVQVDAELDDDAALVANAVPDESGLGFSLSLLQGGGASFEVGGGSGREGAVISAEASTGTGLTSAGWHQVVGVFSAPDLTLYVDGAVAAQATLQGAQPPVTVAPSELPATIGANPTDGGTSFLAGLLADVVLAPVALDATQVQAAYDAARAEDSTTTSSTSTTTTTTSDVTPPPTTTTTVSPQCTFAHAELAPVADAVWLLDDRSPTAVDASGNGNDAQIVDAAAYDQVPGPVATCPADGGLELDGVSTHVVGPDSLTPTTVATELSIVAYVQPGPDLGDTAVLVANASPGTDDVGFSLLLSSVAGEADTASLWFGAAGGTAAAIGDARVSTDGWHQIVGTYDGTTATLYVDGQVAATATTTGPLLAASHPVSLGYDPTTNSDFYQGLLADVAVIPEVLTASTVQQMWDATGGSTTTTGGEDEPTTNGASALLLPAIAVVVLFSVRSRRTRTQP